MSLITELNTDALTAAERLLGARIIREINGNQVVARIVEVEAYDQSDPASHSFRGPTPRTRTMFGPAGYLYVYFTYGMHFCCNVVVGDNGHGAAVLLRAVEILEGDDIIAQNRPGISERQRTNGPGKLCQALAIARDDDGHNLNTPPIQLELQKPIAPSDIVRTTRVGISKAVEQPWRLYIRGNLNVSRI